MRLAPIARLSWGTLIVAGCQAPPVVVPRGEAQLPVVARSVAAPDVTQVAATLPTDAPDAGPYLALGAEECRRLAAINSSPARLIEEAARPPSSPLGQSQVVELRVALAPHLAAEARNRTAAAALEAYYRLLEAEQLTDQLAGAILELDALNTNLDALAQSGLPEPTTAPQLRSRRLSIRAERETARAGARRLSSELLAAIGAMPGSGRINPTDIVMVPPDDLDADQAVAHALAGRPDVNAARVLEHRIDTRTATAVTATLAALAPGLPPLPNDPLANLVAICRSPDDLRHRVAELRADRERSAAGSVRGAVADWNSARAAVGAAKVLLAQEQTRVASAEANDKAGISGAALTLRAARLAQIEAEIGITRAATRWKLADVAVRRELGLLAAP